MSGDPEDSYHQKLGDIDRSWSMKIKDVRKEISRSDDIEEIFQDALSKFKNRLTSKEIAEFQSTSIRDVRNEMARIQKDQENSKTMMNMARIQKFVEAMEQFGQTIEQFTNCSPFVAFIWGPIKFALKVASNWTDTFETLLEAYEQIGDHMPLLEHYRELFDQKPSMRRILGYMYIDIVEFHKKSFRSFSGPVWRQIFRAVWKDFQARFKHILERLRCHRGLISEQASLLHYEQYQHDSQRMLEHIQQYELERETMIIRMEKEEKEERHKQYIATVEWISGAETTSDHEAFCRVWQESPASGKWILKHDKVQNWKDADPPMSSCLWINGIPGAGKTILASAIIDSCIRNEHSKTAYFYCKEGDPERSSCIAVFKGLLRQLISYERRMVPFCYDKLLTSGELTLSSLYLAKQLVELFVKEIPKQYIIIDGLDECDVPERKSILSFFTTLVDKCDETEPGKLRVLFVSQEYHDIRHALSTAAVLSLLPADNENDIRVYVNKWAIDIQRKFELDENQADFIKASTVAKARGMFLFAKLVMPNLFAQPTRDRLLEEIKVSKFPTGLQGAYNRIIIRIKRTISASEWKIVQKLLGWMVCAKRPLKWPEIQIALSIDSKQRTIEYFERKLRVHIGDLCGSLVQTRAGGRVELVHSTAKTHVLNSGYVQELATECSLAALCLQYLTLECFDKDVEEPQLEELVLNGYFAFQDYAVAKWSHHLLAMANSTQTFDMGDEEIVAILTEIELALDEFTYFYEQDLLQHTDLLNSKASCAAFQNLLTYESLLQVQNHVHEHQRKDFNARNEICLKALATTFERNRKFIETLHSSEPRKWTEKNMITLYGERVYKCPKLTCFYFHEGFLDARTRDQHISRHDRPFRCTVTDCSKADFGFTTNRDLDKHKRDYHPELSDLAEVFASPTKATPINTQWRCPHCQKCFTRGFHMRNHIKTHEGSRPHACRECNKAFTRKNDCKRHEKIHSRR